MKFRQLFCLHRSFILGRETCNNCGAKWSELKRRRAWKLRLLRHVKPDDTAYELNRLHKKVVDAQKKNFPKAKVVK